MEDRSLESIRTRIHRCRVMKWVAMPLGFIFPILLGLCIVQLAPNMDLNINSFGGIILLVLLGYVLPMAPFVVFGVMCNHREGVLRCTYKEAVAEAAHLRELLEARMEIDTLEPASCLTADQLVSASLLHSSENIQVTGKGLFRGTLAGHKLQSSYTEINEIVHGLGKSVPVTIYTGQIVILDSPSGFQNKLLLQRKNYTFGHTESIGNSLANKISESFANRFGGNLLNMFVRRVFSSDQCNDPRRLDAYEVPVETAGWLAWSDAPRAACQALADNSELLKRLKSTRNLDFVLYRRDSIVLGGQYDIIPEECTDSYVESTAREAVKNLFEEGISTALYDSIDKEATP